METFQEDQRLGRKQLILIFKSPIEPWYFQRYGMDLLSQHFDLAYWDTSSFFYQSGRPITAGIPATISYEYLSTWNDLAKLSGQLNQAHAVILVGFPLQFKSLRDRHLVARISKSATFLSAVVQSNELALATHERGGQPRTSRVDTLRTKPLIESLQRFKQRFNVLIANAAGLSRIGFRVDPCQAVWVAGCRLALPKHLVSPDTKVRFVHSLDFDEVALSRSLKRKDKYALFLDAMGPLHPDYLTLGLTFPSTRSEYSEVIRRALTRLQIDLGRRIVVAAHPRAQKGSLDDIYAGFDVMYEGTARAMSNAAFVISATPSTSIGMAVVLRLPVVLLSSWAFDSRLEPMKERISEVLQCPILDIDNDSTERTILSVDEQRYLAFEQAFVKRPGTSQVPFWSQVLEDLTDRK